MVRATLRAPMPAMPANGIASPATTTPSTADDRDHHHQVGEHAVRREPLLAGHGHAHRVRT